MREYFLLEKHLERRSHRKLQKGHIRLRLSYRRHSKGTTAWLFSASGGLKVASVKWWLTPFHKKITSQMYLEKEQMSILEFIDQVGRITVNDVVDILRCPKRTAQLQLQRLKKLKLIKQVGRGPVSAYMQS